MKRVAVWTVELLALLVAAYLVLASAAEYHVSSRLKGQLSLQEEPAVRVAGFPFLTQAVAGEYRKVDVATDYVGWGTMHNLGMFAELYRVHVPLSDVLTGSVRNVSMDSVATSRCRLRIWGCRGRNGVRENSGNEKTEFRQDVRQALWVGYATTSSVVRDSRQMRGGVGLSSENSTC